MTWHERILAAVRRAGRQLDEDVIDELAAHAQAAYQAARARGDSVDEADRYLGRLIDVWIGEADALRRLPRRPPLPAPPAATGRRLTGLGKDVRYGLRLLSRHRGFATLAILTVALAIGVTTTIFSVLDGVLLRPLPWPAADRLVRLTETHTGATRQTPLSITNVTYLQWFDDPATISGIGAWSRGAVTLTTAGDSERIQATAVTASTFPLLGVPPVAGRTFAADDAAEVVLSFGLWQERFAGARDILEHSIQINGQPYIVVGVMPRDFTFPDRDTRLWRPFRVPPAVGPNGNGAVITTVSAMARLRPGVTPARAAAEATARARSAPISGNGLMAYYGTTGPAEILAEPALDALTHDVRPGLIALFIAVSLLLLTAVANIASLQLARATTRYREMGIRSALGAGTPRLLQQLVVEHLILAAAGGLLGLGLSAALHRALPSWLPADFPRLDAIGLRSTVVLFALAVTGATGVVLGALPAIHLRRLRLVDALTDTGSGAIGGARSRARAWIMTAQVAIACALLVGALLLSRSFVSMLTQDRGFESDHLLTARLSMPATSTPQARIDAFEAFVQAARSLPQAPAIALTTGLPLSNSENISGFTMPSVRPPVGVDIQAHAVRSVVTSDYCAALGLRVIQGRGFRDSDDSPSAPKVVIVNRTFARQYLTDKPLGDRIRNFMNGDGIDFEVIGVVDDMLRRGLTDQVQPEIYSLLRQSPRPSVSQDVVVRSAGDPMLLAQPLRELARQVAPAATIESIRSMDDRIVGSLARPRLYAVLLVVFASSALLIACVGLVGVLSYAVAQRTREIALRAALGAGPRQVFGLILAQGLAVTSAGLLAGLAVAFVAARYLATLLYGISWHDGLSFLVAPFVLAVVALAACVVPAIRAVRIDPLTALRA